MSADTGAPVTSDAAPEPTSPAPVRRRRRGAAFWAGILLVLGGLGLLGYVAWEMWGTTVVSKQTQQRLVDELDREWSAAPATTIEQAEREVPIGEGVALIRIPAFGEDYVVPVLEGIGDRELSSGYGHFPGSALPGEEGNFALAAHRITHGEPLRDMPKLRPGDEVVVETRDAVHTYELVTDPNDLVVTFEDVWVVDPLPTHPDGGVQPPQEPGQRLITLTTCSELFHTDNRMIAFGTLVDTAPKGAGGPG